MSPYSMDNLTKKVTKRLIMFTINMCDNIMILLSYKIGSMMGWKIYEIAAWPYKLLGFR